MSGEPEPFSFDLVEPGLPMKDGCTITTHDPVYVVAAGSSVTLRYTVRNKAGAPLDLSAYFTQDSESDSASTAGEGNELQVYIQEALRLRRGPDYRLELPVHAENPAIGEFHIEVDTVELRIPPGVYIMEIGARIDGKIKQRWQSLLLVETSLYLDPEVSRRYPGPPTLAEIRARLADRSSDDNRLLADVDFELNDIVSAYTSPVAYFNEQPPVFDDLKYDTRNFPSREMWLVGLVGTLYRTAALRRMRNDVPFEMQGVNVSEDAYWAQYDVIGNRMFDEFKSFVNVRKTAMSMDRMFGIHPGPYDIFGVWPK